MFRWPTIDEPDLLDRLAMGDREFDEFLLTLAAKFPPRAYDATALEWAIGYPWERPPGSYVLTGAGAELLGDMSAGEREEVLARYLPEDGGRLPLLAIGSNAAPDMLERKFAHFPDENDREVLALTGYLHDFDVGAAAQPTMYGAMPATLFPSPGTEVGTTILWVTSNQLTQLTWSELTYRLGRLTTRFDVDLDGTSFVEVLVFLSRFGAFCVDGRPVALAAVPATGRTVVALTQEQLLDAAAALAIGPEAKAEALVRAIFEEPNEIVSKIAGTVRRASVPFASERWTPFSP